MCHLAHLLTLTLPTLVELMLLFFVEGEGMETGVTKEKPSSQGRQKPVTNSNHKIMALGWNLTQPHWLEANTLTTGVSLFLQAVELPTSPKTGCYYSRMYNIFLKSLVFLLYLEDSSNARDQSHANIFLLQEQKESG